MRHKNIKGAGVIAYLLVASALAVTAFAQTLPAAYTSVSLYLPGGLIAGTIEPAPSGQSDFPATRYTYDSNERLSTVQTGYLTAWPGTGAPSGWGSLFIARKMVTYGYDANGRKVTETVTGYLNGASAGAVELTQFSYDTLDRLICTAVRMNPSAFGSLPSSACNLGTQGSYGYDRITQNTYDSLNRLTQVVKALGSPNAENYAAYTYTADSQQQYITDANGNESKLAYDGFDRLADWYFPSPTAAHTVNTSDYEAYGHDPNGNRTSLRKRDGETITYSYDSLNRQTLKQVPTASQDVYYGYDLRGLMIYARFGSATGVGITNTYDGFGRLTSTTNTMGGVSRTVGQGFDADGDRTSVTYPDTNYFDYDYDGLDRLSDVRENGSTTIVSESYDPLLLLGETRGAVTSSYGYDSVERPESWTDNLASTAADVTTTFAYNPADQIVSRTLTNTAYAYTSYANGTVSYSSNGLNEYASVAGTSYTYGQNGNLTSDGATSYTYDVENRLLTESGAYTATVTYDPLGRLFQIVTSSATTQFLYDGDELFAEYNGSGTLLQRYVHASGADEPLIWYDGAAVSSATRRSLQMDYQGSIDSVADSSGNEIGINLYDEYGRPATSNVGRFQYTGQAWMPELGQYYYKARMYDPRLGRFLQTDPVGYKNDLDLYVYVGNDPIDGRDPTGLYVCSGSNDNCNAVSTAISTVQAAISSGRLTKSESASVSKVLSFLGKPGEKNGVAIDFSDKISALGQTSIDSKTGDVTITLGGDYSKYYTSGYRGADAKGEQAGILAHEGQHGIDERALGRDPKTAQEEQRTEHNAFSVQSYVSKGLNDNSVRGLWSPSWGASSADQMRQKAVDQNTNADVRYWEGGE